VAGNDGVDVEACFAPRQGFDVWNRPHFEQHRQQMLIAHEITGPGDLLFGNIHDRVAGRIAGTEIPELNDAPA
jgi:hypothetical protein